MAFGRVGRYAFISLIHCHSKGLLRVSVQPGWLERCTGAKRHLLSSDVIKLQDFQQRKLAVAHLVTGSKDNYFEQFNQKLQKYKLILKDELRVLLHMCQSAEDLVTARDAIIRYHEENRNLAFGEFRFGPLFMRLCYELGAEEMAASTITDQRLKGFFKDGTSFNIAIDMLFTKECYERALDVVREMKNQGVLFNKDTYMLACGTCYKLNSTETYRICSTLLEEGQSKGHFIPRHAYCFAVALALRQNDVEKAQSLYSQIQNTDGKICQNLKVVISAMSGAVTDCIHVLHAALLPKSPTFVKKLEFSLEVVELLRLRSEHGLYMEKVEQIVWQLEQAGQVTGKSVDYMLCHAPQTKRRPQPILEEERISRRTLTPLRSSLRSE